ncbi:hypothetical protein [Streptomyces chryseus]|uniref:hypothetical protein n=1 Tax=Streptomyces chryseus TaxID=68186 RepID=UPI00110F8C21|nr:hypothetical protein [Streptomyces chryseus]GGX01963.1 hypothetical protein GCM10010353_16980 [Streptomyces chryseus]
MSARTLPRHPRTGIVAAGWRKPRPGEDLLARHPFWPIAGGAPDDDQDEDDDDTDDDQDEDADDKSDKDKDADKVDHKSEAEKYKALMRKWQQRAKDNAAAVKERDQLKREGMSDLEKKVDEAVAAARAEERVKSGVRVARSAFLAAASGRLDNAKDVADDVNLKKYVDDDGEVDEDAIAELVDRLAPKGSDKDDEDDDQDERDTRRRRRAGGGHQGARNGSGRRKTKSGAVSGTELYEELIGPRQSAKH